MPSVNKLSKKRQKILKNKKPVPSGNVKGWLFNDETELTVLGFKDKYHNPKMRENNFLDKMR